MSLEQENNGCSSNFKFHEPFQEDDDQNGLRFNEFYVPSEILAKILSHLDYKDILNYTLVCKKWCNTIKSTSFWTDIYKEKFPQKTPKRLPWYVYYCYFAFNYFDTNLLRNANGQEGFKYWELVQGGGRFKIEENGIDVFPNNCKDFNGYKSCFATTCCGYNVKFQQINLNNNRLMWYIFNKYKPHVYVSEWVNGNYDQVFTSRYELICRLCKFNNLEKNEEAVLHQINYRIRVSLRTFVPPSITVMYPGCKIIHTEKASYRILERTISGWQKVSLIMREYPNEEVNRIVFEHLGRSWTFQPEPPEPSHPRYFNMTGGVLLISFDSVNPEK